MQYLRAKRARSKSPAGDTTDEVEEPVLTEEDEAFLQRLADEGTPPQLPERPPPPLPRRPQDLPEAGSTQNNNAQLVLVDEEHRTSSLEPQEPTHETQTTFDASQVNKKLEAKKADTSKRSKWSFLRRDSRDAKRKAAAKDLMSAAEALKSADAQPNEDGTVSDPEAQKEEDEMSQVLEDLNLAAVNNRVFSLSKESQELLQKYALPERTSLI